MELENLLPFDIKYIFYDKVQEKNWSTFLRKGGLMPVHCVTLDQFVLLNVEIQDTRKFCLQQSALVPNPFSSV